MKTPWESDVALTGRSGYSIKMPADPEERENFALARGKEMDMSPKHAVELCSALRGKRLEPAKAYLERVIEKRQAVPFRRYNGKVGHRVGKGFGPGRYPVKAASAFLKLLEQAEANAEAHLSNVDAASLRIVHIAASRGVTTPGYMSRARGRTTASDHETVNIEIMVSEDSEEQL